MIAKILVIGIRQGDRTAGRRLAEHGDELRRPLNAGERVERDAFEHREDGGVQTDAERQDGDDRQREDGILRERWQPILEPIHRAGQDRDSIDVYADGRRRRNGQSGRRRGDRRLGRSTEGIDGGLAGEARKETDRRVRGRTGGNPETANSRVVPARSPPTSSSPVRRTCCRCTRSGSGCRPGPRRRTG